MKLFAIYIILLFFITWSNFLIARTDTLKAQTILPYLNSQKQLVQDIFIEADSAEKYNISVLCIKIKSDNDSETIFRRSGIQATLKKGVQIYHTLVKHLYDSGYVHQDYYQILRRTGTLPTGNYRTHILLRRNLSVREFSFEHSIDSALSKLSSSRTLFQNTLSPDKKVKVLGMQWSAGNVKGVSSNLQLLERYYKKAGKAFKSRGLSTEQRQRSDGIYFDVYYKEHFVGYYKVDSSKNFLSSIDRERNRLTSNASSLASNELESMQSIFTQVKDLNKRRKEEKEGSGEIGLTVNLSNGQEENAANENNYYELRGRIEMPVMDIPVSVEAFYTSQDKNRRVKASFIRLHYDTEKAKEELQKMISGYNEKYESSVSKGKGLQSVYQTYVSKLRSEQGKLLNELKKEASLSELNGLSLDTAGYWQKIFDSLNSKMPDTPGLDISDVNKTLARSKAVQDSAHAMYTKAMEKYKRAQEIQQNIDKYQKLIDQYKNINYFDSLLAYDDIRDLKNSDDLSYKKLAKKAGVLLPEGDTRKFTAGLTHFDLGIFSKQVSTYTLAGQNIKGLDAGYDFGLFQTAFTVGGIEYAGRDGSLDKYTGYSGRVMFKPAKKQKASIIYYGYTPSKRMLTEDKFFREVNESMPSFRSPVHIVAVTYSGDIWKNIRFETEAATSFRNTDKASTSTNANERLAYNVKAEGDIPNTTISVDAAYEHVGKLFENNTAPVNLSGLDRYTLGSKGVFFKNFLAVGVEYIYLQQQSFSGKGGNSKWGFEIKTRSKRYPSVSLSYKPFATFRTPNDTLDIPQRPMVGSVWTGKASYQVKKKGYTLRFTAIYNRNSTTMDTLATRSSIFQFNTIYQDKKLMGMVNLSRIDNGSTDSGSVHQRTNLVSVNLGYRYNDQWNLSGGVDVGAARFGLSRLGGTAGCSYNFKKMPVFVRLAGRYNTYRLSEDQVWKQLISGNVDVLWRFKFKVRKTE